MGSSSSRKGNSSACGKNGGSRFDVLVDEDCKDADLITINMQVKAKGKDVVKGHIVLAEISNIMEKVPKSRDYFKVYNKLCSKSLSKGKQSKSAVSTVSSNISGRGISFEDTRKELKKDKGKNKLSHTSHVDSSVDQQDEMEDSGVLQQLH
ncbi:hypothetical protein ACOSP7_014915 [Xanthoceras sorbifolium]